MSCFKYSFLLFILLNSAYAQKFSSKECLVANFDTNIKHEGKFFGLVKNNLSIKKEGCLFQIVFDNILETTWKIDICREPIHLKVISKGNETFYKRKDHCSDNSSNEFCEYWGDLKENLQDYGLIYAQGERESLQTSHGQTYCTYLLLQRYLDDGLLFSKYDEPKSIFEKQRALPPKSTHSAPAVDSASEESANMKSQPSVTDDASVPNQVINLDEGKDEAANKEDEDKPRF